TAAVAGCAARALPAALSTASLTVSSSAVAVFSSETGAASAGMLSSETTRPEPAATRALRRAVADRPRAAARVSGVRGVMGGGAAGGGGRRAGGGGGGRGGEGGVGGVGSTMAPGRACGHVGLLLAPTRSAVGFGSEN